MAHGRAFALLSIVAVVAHARDAAANLCAAAFTSVAVPRAANSAQRIALLSTAFVHHTSDGGAHWTQFAVATSNVRSFLVDDDGTTVILEGLPGTDRLRIFAPDGSVRVDLRGPGVLRVDAAFGVIAYVDSSVVRVSRDRGRTFVVAEVPPFRNATPATPNLVAYARDVRIESTGVVRVLEVFDTTELRRGHQARELRCRFSSRERCANVPIDADPFHTPNLDQLAPDDAILANSIHSGFWLLQRGAFRPLVPQPHRRGRTSSNDRSMLFEYSSSTLWRLDGDTFSTVATALPSDHVGVALDAAGRALVARPSALLRRDAPHRWTTLVDCARRSP